MEPHNADITPNVDKLHNSRKFYQHLGTINEMLIQDSERVVMYCLYRAVLPGERVMTTFIGYPYLWLRETFEELMSVSPELKKMYSPFARQLHAIICKKMTSFDLSTVVDFEEPINVKSPTEYTIKDILEELMCDYNEFLTHCNDREINIPNVDPSALDTSNRNIPLNKRFPQEFATGKHWATTALHYMDKSPEFYSESAFSTIDALCAWLDDPNEENRQTYYSHQFHANDRVQIDASGNATDKCIPFYNTHVSIEWNSLDCFDMLEELLGDEDSVISGPVKIPLYSQIPCKAYHTSTQKMKKIIHTSYGNDAILQNMGMRNTLCDLGIKTDDINLVLYSMYLIIRQLELIWDDLSIINFDKKMDIIKKLQWVCDKSVMELIPNDTLRDMFILIAEESKKNNNDIIQPLSYKLIPFAVRTENTTDNISNCEFYPFDDYSDQLSHNWSLTRSIEL